MNACREGWPALARRVRRARRLLLMLDYDGVLTPLVRHPRIARLPAAHRRLLRQLSRQPGTTVGVLSGRKLSELRAMVGVRGLIYGGNHGLELTGPVGRFVHPEARRSAALIRQLARHLAQAVGTIPGAWVEPKTLSLSLHYRGVRPGQRARLQQLFYRVVGPLVRQRRVRVTTGKRILEVRPPVAWDKGRALWWLLQRPSLRGAVPVFIGDDLTDEDAFRAIRRRGVGIRVGPVLRTAARYRLRSPREVAELLRRLQALGPRRP
ncbi:MAG: trehalose-phosphatase [Candidatus Omnitrophica bacterium]|nr:trehalose-phosphatase [Candidatus Omnitrophota bacterium]